MESSTSISGNGHATSTLSLFRGNGDGTYQAPTTISGVSSRDDMTAADLNHDGILDLVVPHGAVGQSGGLQVLLGLGNGTFSAPTYYDTGEGDWLCRSVVVADFDNDGHADIAALNVGQWSPFLNGSIKFLWGAGNGTFQSGIRYPLQQYMTDVVVGNIDADPSPELLAIGGSSYSANVLDYIGNRQFQLATPVTVRPGAPPSPNDYFYQATLSDLNNDSKLDFAVVDAANGNLHVMLGIGDGTFQTATDYSVPQPQDIRVGDITGDGWVDLIVSHWQAVRSLLEPGRWHVCGAARHLVSRWCPRNSCSRS